MFGAQKHDFDCTVLYATLHMKCVTIIFCIDTLVKIALTKATET